VARAVTGIVLTGLGALAVLSAVTGGGKSVLPRAGMGALLTIIGVVVLGPVVAASASALIGLIPARFRGISGSLARQNAMRNPRRTSASAAALMVGVAVVTLFTVFAASLKASMSNDVAQSFRGDLAITAPAFGGGGLSPQLVAEVSRLPEVRIATGLGGGNARISGHNEKVSVVDPAKIDEVLDLNVARGSLASLHADQVAVSKKTADDKGLRLGSALPVTLPDGTTMAMTVGAVYQTRGVAGDYILTRQSWAAHAVQELDSAVYISLNRGISVPAGRATVKKVAAAYGEPTVQDRTAYAAAAGKGINTVLGLIYVMLALAIVIALLGISNTISLSTHERTHELGLLRAVGQTRGQLRSMVRWESVIVASFGTVGGLGVGVFLGWALVKAADTAQGIARFTAPTGQLMIVLVVGAVAGVLAGIRPARRAARLDVLAAIAAQ
jgi:putative ABC transport system permease protein